MCLETITKREDYMPAAAIGYKAVIKFAPERGTGRHYYGPEFFPNEPIQIGGGWASADEAADLFTSTVYPANYRPGVHAWLCAGDALESLRYHFQLGRSDRAVVAVYLRGPIAEGQQGGRSVIVYKEMTIIEEIKHSNDIFKSRTWREDFELTKTQ